MSSVKLMLEIMELSILINNKTVTDVVCEFAGPAGMFSVRLYKKGWMPADKRSDEDCYTSNLMLDDFSESELNVKLEEIMLILEEIAKLQGLMR